MSQKKEGPGPPITRRQMLAQTAKGAALASLVPLAPTQTLLAETTQLQGAKTGAQSTKPGHPTAKLIALETEKLKLSVDPRTAAGRHNSRAARCNSTTCTSFPPTTPRVGR